MEAVDKGVGCDCEESDDWEARVLDTELCDEAVVYEVAKEVGWPVRSLETDALVLCGVPSFVLEGCVRLDLGRPSVAGAVTVTVVTPFVLLGFELIGASVGHAVRGPNFLMK